MSLNTTDYLIGGALRSVLGFPFEHPCEVAKLKSQLSPCSSAREVMSTIYKQNGFKGFYDGALSNMTKRGIRVAYRWPMVASLHSFWNTHLPQSAQMGGITTHLTTAASIAAIETAVVLPIERLFFSKIDNLNYCSFLENKSKYKGIKALYQGAPTMFYNHGSSWTTFMMTNHLVKHIIQQVDPKKKHSILTKCLGSVVIAANLMVVDLPLEFTRAQIQKYPEYQQLSTRQVIRALFQQHGFKGFYTGWKFAIVHKTLQTLFGSTFFETMTSVK